MGAKHRASPPLQKVGRMSPVHPQIYAHAFHELTRFEWAKVTEDTLVGTKLKQSQL